MQIDHSELDVLARDLAAAPTKVIAAIRPVAEKAGVNMKRQMRRAASGHAHLPGLPWAAEYNVAQTATSIEVEVGFRKKGQGNLANIAAFGSVNNAPVMDITQPLRDEVPKFMRWVSKVGAEAL